MQTSIRSKIQRKPGMCSPRGATRTRSISPRLATKTGHRLQKPVISAHLLGLRLPGPSKSPFKPEIVMEAGNRGLSPASNGVLSLDSLGLLTTGAAVDNSPVVGISATSAAAAQASRLAARLSAIYPHLWPETIRALIIHSAEWTLPMRDAVDAAPNKRAAYALLRRFGYGVPSFERAAASASSHLALISQNTIRPYRGRGGRKFRDCHFYRLPWPTEVLEGLGEQDVRLKITLSYFVEPNPERSAAVDPQNYQSYGLRFDLRRRLEDISNFVKRVAVLKKANA